MSKLTKEKFGQIVQILTELVTRTRTTKTLSDVELALILSVDQEDLREKLQTISSARYWCQTEARYRVRHKELSKLSTEEIERRLKSYHEAWAAAVAADVNDEADDSLYEAPPVDSDESILFDLLQERKGQKASGLSTTNIHVQNLGRSQADFLGRR